MGFTLDEIVDKINHLSENEKQEDKRDLKELQEKTEEVDYNTKKTIWTFRRAAKKLDDVQRDCKTAHAIGTSAGIAGGLLSIAGGVATLMTAGIASPLLLAGLVVGGAGATTNIGAAIVEKMINSAEIKEAEKQLAKTRDSIHEANRIVQNVLMAKDGARLIYIYYLAETLKLGGPLVLKILRELVSLYPVETSTKMVLQVAEKLMTCFQEIGLVSAKAATQAGAQGAGKAAGQSADDVVQATIQAGAQSSDDILQAGATEGAKAFRETIGKVAIGVNVVFLIFDAIDLGFTIRDLVEERGSEAAEVLRQKADAIENHMKQ